MDFRIRDGIIALVAACALTPLAPAPARADGYQSGNLAGYPAQIQESDFGADVIQLVGPNGYLSMTVNCHVGKWAWVGTRGDAAVARAAANQWCQDF